MTNKQAAKLRAGMRIRRKRASDDDTIYVVERVEHVESPRDTHRNDYVVLAGGQAFKPWEIERASPLQGWPKD